MQIREFSVAPSSPLPPHAIHPSINLRKHVCECFTRIEDRLSTPMTRSTSSPLAVTIMIGIFDSARSARLIAMSRAEIDRMNVLHDLAEGRIKPGQHDRLLRSRQNQQKRIRRTTDKTERMNLQWVRHEKNCQKILAVLPGCFFGLQSPGKFKSLSRIPYAAEQGIILTEQGNLTQEQRILLVNTKLIPDQVFDIRRGRRHQGFGLDGARRKKSFFQAVLRPLALSSRGALAGLIANELRTMLVRQQAFVRGLF